MIAMDPKILIHEFEDSEYIGQDRYKQPAYSEPIKVERVRIDETSVFSRDGDQKKILANAVIFIYNGLSSYFGPFKEQSKVVFDDKEYIVQKIVPVSEPYSKELFSIELEVL